MNPQTKFSIKIFFKYLLLDPWTEKVRLNLITVVWIVIVISILLKIFLLLFIAIIVGVVLHAIKEYKAGKHMYWYRKTKYDKIKKNVTNTIRKDIKDKAN